MSIEAQVLTKLLRGYKLDNAEVACENIIFAIYYVQKIIKYYRF
jgi:hypothetical protein